MVVSSALICSTTQADIAVLIGPSVVSPQDALNGFASVCSEKKVEFRLAPDLNNESQVVDQIKAGTFRLILAIGPQAVEISRTNFSDLPVVFTQVSTTANVETKAKNMTGVLQSAFIEEYLTLLKSINNKIKRLGLIYSEPYNNEFVRQAEKLASKEGITLVHVPISSSEDVANAIREVMGKSDAVWFPLDPSLMAEETIREVGAACLEQKTLCIGATDRYVRFGSVFALVLEASDAGRAAGELANKILDGTKPSKLSVVEMDTPQVIVNLKVVKQLGLTLPKNIENAASKVYQ